MLASSFYASTDVARPVSWQPFLSSAVKLSRDARTTSPMEKRRLFSATGRSILFAHSQHSWGKWLFVCDVSLFSHQSGLIMPRHIS